MSSVFFNGNAYASRAEANVSNFPISMACWVYPTRTNSGEVPIAMTNPASGGDRLGIILQGDLGGDRVRLLIDGASTGTYDTSSGFVADQWQHIAAVVTSSSQAIYLNGGNKGTGNDSYSPLTLTNTYLGSWSRLGIGFAQYFAGRISHAAFWNAALTDDDVAMLAEAISPLFVRRDGLVSYYPMQTALFPLPDYVSGNSLASGGGSPYSVSNLGVRIFMPTGVKLSVDGVGSGGGGDPDPVSRIPRFGVTNLSGGVGIV